MTNPRKSAFLTLGIPFGTSSGAAAKAFARATRRVRRDPDAPYDIEDVNWALHAVEHGGSDSLDSLETFRMPANPGIYSIPDGVGLLNPPVVVLKRQSLPTTPQDLEALHAEVVTQVAREIRNAIVSSDLPVLHKFNQEEQ